ncbi:hypothetical protein K8I61_04615 [bacterium]|nr:hypothetical protein [bacterium]
MTIRTRPDSARRRRLFAAIAVGLLASLAVVEAYARLRYPELNLVVPFERRAGFQFARHDPEIGWAGKPGASGYLDVGVAREFVRFNELGLRGTRPPRDTPAVALLGDSFGWGFGLSEASTPAAQLAGMIGRPVAPLAFPGYGTDQEFLLFRRFAIEQRAFPVESVVAIVCVNDIDDIDQVRAYGHNKCHLRPAGDAAGFVNDGAPVPPNSRWMPMLLRSRAATLFLVKKKSRYSEGRKRGATGAALSGVEQFGFVLGLLRAEAAREGAPLAVFVIPPQEIVIGASPDPLRAQIREIVAASRKQGIATIYPLRAFRERARIGANLFRPDGHWSPEGAQTAARAIADFLVAQKMIAPVS